MAKRSRCGSGTERAALGMLFSGGTVHGASGQVAEMHEIRAIIVGYGQMGRLHLDTLQSRLGVRPIGIVRRAADPVEGDVPVYTSLRAALDQRPDLAIVSTPHYLHYEQAQLCLRSGCHLLVEKPLALRYAEAVELHDLAKTQERFLVVGLQRRYEGLSAIFRAAVAAGDLGRVELVHGFFAHRFAPSGPEGWRTDPGAVGAGILDDSAIHLIDLLLSFSGGRVRAATGRLLGGSSTALPHSFACVLDTDAGPTVSACGSYLSPAASVQEEISIFGTNGSLFGRRFCRQWNADPPAVFFKSADGSVSREYDMTAYPSGRALPLVALLEVLQHRRAPDALHSEVARVLETHRAVELIRDSRASY